jgi:hypothetical protein
MRSLAFVLPLVDKAPDPADVKPGWLAFVIFLAMFAAVVLLWLSMRRHLKKVDETDFDVAHADAQAVRSRRTTQS